MEYMVAQYLSSIEFYRMINNFDVLLQGGEQIVIDMSEVHRIDGNVIPNLILMGKWLERKTGIIPLIRLGRTFDAGYLKKYLFSMKFYDFTRNIYRYEDENDKYGGFEGKDMDKRNVTLHYEFPYNEYEDLPQNDSSRQRFRNAIAENVTIRVIHDTKEFLYRYFDMFNYGPRAEKYNRLADILGQIVGNSMSKGISEAYLTVQANYKRNKIIVAASDTGCGMRESMAFNRTEQNTDPKGYFLLNDDPKTEEEAIVEGLCYRKGSGIYGLYNAVLELIDKWDGIVRIHSNDTQLILTSNAVEAYKEMRLLSYFNEYNRRNTAMFPGTHIEIEVPMRSEDNENN